MPLIIPSNSISDLGYNVDNSLRFDDGSSDYLSRTPSGAGNRKTFTISLWFKRSDITRRQALFNNTDGSGQNGVYYDLQADDTLLISDYGSGSFNWNLETTQVFRDVSAWYHLVISVDTTQSTASNRVKIYINGTQITNFDASNYPSQNSDTLWNRTDTLEIGSYNGTGNYFGGYMAEVVHIDGQQLDPTSFGEFDSDSGIWKPIDVSGLTFGTNGFYLDFESSGSLGNDVSGNGNNFTVNNLTSIDQTTDTPTNNYCTWNPLLIRTGRTLPTFSEGNLKCQHNDLGGNTPSWGTFLLNSGKWYWEVKVTSFGIMYCGIWQPGYNNADVDDALNGIVVYRWDGKKQAETAATNATYGDSWSVGDIIGVAVDVDTGTIWFSKNGVWQNSATQAEIEAGTTTNSAYTGKSFSTNSIIPAVSAYQFSGNSIVEANFGNPTFSISSGNSDGNGFGQFEYAPPSGYLALCTKNLATDG